MLGPFITILIARSAITVRGTEDPSPTNTIHIFSATATNTVRHAFDDFWQKQKDVWLTNRVADQSEELASGLQASAFSKAQEIIIVPDLAGGWGEMRVPPAISIPSKMGFDPRRAETQSTTPPTAHIRVVEAMVVVDWTGWGILQYAPSITGPWADIYAGSSLYSTGKCPSMGFYRIRNGK